MPYWRLSSFYFFYFATLGALVPYWGPYLKSLGFSAAEIGNLMALILATKIVAPNLWGWIADHSGRCMGVVRLAAFLTLVFYTGVFFGTGFWWLAGVMAGFSFFWNASLPQLEATTLNYLAGRPGHYGRVRLWGSIGFIVTVWALGPVLDRYGVPTLLPVLWGLILGIWAASLAVPEGACATPRAAQGRLRGLLRRPEVVAFLVVCFLMQASHAPYYTFYTIYLGEYGYSKSLIGFLWAVGVICEIGVFLALPRLQGRWGLSWLLLGSLALAALRWLLIAFFPQHLGVLLFAQVLHAATFGAYHASAVHFVHRFFTGRHQHRGQALYSSVSFGLGGAAGSFYSGYSWMWWGPAATFLVAAGLALLAFVLARLFIRPSAA